MDKYILFADAKSPHTLKWLKELICHFDIYVISLNGCSDEVASIVVKEKIFVLNETVVTAGGNIKLLFKYFDLVKVIEKIQPKYLNAHYLSSYGFLSALVKKKYPYIKLIQSTWGTDVLVTPFEGVVKKRVANFALSKADLITSDSFYMSDVIKSLSSNEKIMTFPFGLETFDTNEKIIKDKNLIFSNRALVENYNIDTILEWFLQFKETEMRLIIANNGTQKEKLEQFVLDNGLKNQVTFVGFLTHEEQNKFYRKATYYISIPTSDSTAVSLLEAMRFGCYPIVSNLPANREWIIDNFNGSFFCEDMSLPILTDEIIVYNQKIIEKNAIFSKSIEQYIKKVESL